MSRIAFTLQPDAQSFCDKTHAQMIATSVAYAQSAASGQTARWDAPRQDFDEQGKPTSDFYVIVKDRVLPTLTAGEAAKLSPITTDGNTTK